MTKAEHIAKIFDKGSFYASGKDAGYRDKAGRFWSPEGWYIDDLCMKGAKHVERDNGVTRYVFHDDSVILVRRDEWCIEGDSPYEWNEGKIAIELLITLSILMAAFIAALLIHGRSLSHNDEVSKLAGPKSQRDKPYYEYLPNDFHSDN